MCAYPLRETNIKVMKNLPLVECYITQNHDNMHFLFLILTRAFENWQGC